MTGAGGVRPYRGRMQRFVVMLHVLAAVLLIGPLVLTGFWGRGAIRRGDADGTRQAFRVARWATAGSLLVAVLGALAVAWSGRYSFGTPWVVIATTLYLVLLGVSAGYTVPALRRAGLLLQRRSAVTALEEPDDTERDRLSGLASRLAGAGGLSLAVAATIVILMVLRPFGA
ncbi:hypothetical protein GCM10010199_50680 [Dactylosporangium roseum]